MLFQIKLIPLQSKISLLDRERTYFYYMTNIYKKDDTWVYFGNITHKSLSYRPIQKLG